MREAQTRLFPHDGQAIQLSSSLSKDERDVMVALVPVLKTQLAASVEYYSSLAYSPDEGLISAAMQGAFNYHDIAAADAAARAACNKAKKSGSVSCRVAARILPQGFSNRDFTLSQPATAAFQESIRDWLTGSAMAVSRSTGAWGIGASADAALAECRIASKSASDCQVDVEN